jgi:uncharacterized protein YbjT (DUF2867 family)
VSQPAILVTGATGKTGGAVARQLLEQGRRVGADIAVADLFDFEQSYAAMRGTKGACFCPPFHPYMTRAAAAFSAAAREAELESGRRGRSISASVHAV